MTTPCAARLSTWRPTREALDGMAGRTSRASIRAPSRCVCHRRHLCVPSRVHRTPPIMGLLGGTATSTLLKSSASEPRGRQESMSAGTLASAKSQGDAGCDHGQVRQLSKLRHAGIRRPIIRPARLHPQTSARRCADGPTEQTGSRLRPAPTPHAPAPQNDWHDSST